MDPLQENAGTATITDVPRAHVRRTAFTVLLAISFCHLLNDMVQSLVPAIYPLLKTSFHLDFGQIGLITLTYQLTASLLQPLVGFYTDRRPMPYSLAAGMSFTLVGLVMLSMAPTYPTLLGSAMLVGMGSAIFHPESSRVARLASGGQHGLAQSVFQVGGNAGSASGPLLAAFIVKSLPLYVVSWLVVVVVIYTSATLLSSALRERRRADITGIKE